MHPGKISLVLFVGLNLPVLFAFILGCGPDCNPFFFETRKLYVLTSIKLRETSIEVKYDHVYDQSPSIRYDSLIFDVYAQQKELLARSGVPGIAYGCDPVLNFRDQLLNINVYSDQDYNDDYPEGSNLNSLFKYGLNLETTLYEVTEFIDLVNQQGLGRDHFLFYLTIPPNQTRIHNIDFEIELVNGEKFHASIESLTIRN